MASVSFRNPPFLTAANNNSCSETVGSGLAVKVMLRFSGRLEVHLIILLIWERGTALSVAYCASVGWNFSDNKIDDLRLVIGRFSYYCGLNIILKFENQSCFFPEDILLTCLAHLRSS